MYAMTSENGKKNCVKDVPRCREENKTAVGKIFTIKNKAVWKETRGATSRGVLKWDNHGNER